MGLIEQARKGISGSLIKKIAKSENISSRKLCKDIASGYTVIPKNKQRRISKPCGIGRDLLVKVNVNIGLSPDSSDIKSEMKKLDMSVSLGADTIMDLSVGKNAGAIRRMVTDHSPIPVGTVPVYEVAAKAENNISNITEKALIDILETQAKEGVDFFTLHAGINKKTAAVLRRSKRLIKVVSRGGAILYKWMMINNRENPFYSRFDHILDLAREYDITLSLGDGMRPGAIADAGDRAQFSELRVLGDLQKRALKKGVQTIIEGPGHVPLNKIKENIEKQKRICNGAPFYVLGPLVTDIAPGYDHITAAIGGAVAAAYGADYLCYVTPAEHVRLPTFEDVKEGLVASKIAAHAADIARGHKQAWQKDISISTARNVRDWDKQFRLSIDSEKPRAYRNTSNPKADDVCTMCGKYCPIKITEGSGK